MRHNTIHAWRRGALSVLAAAALTVPLALPASAETASEESAGAESTGEAATGITLGTAEGPEVTGGDSLAGATELEAGLSQTVLERGESGQRSEDGTLVYFKLPTLEAGERALVSAQLMVDPYQEPTSRTEAGLTGELVSGTGELCAQRSHGDATVGRYDFDSLPLIWFRSEEFDPERAYGCHEDQTGDVYFSLQRTGEWQDETPMTVQLRVTVEPAMDPTTLGEPQTDELPPVSVSLTGEAEPVSGGSSFTTAARVESGTVITDSVLPYEAKFYKVNVQEGQRLNYRVSVEDNSNASAEAIQARTYNPVLENDFMIFGDNSLRQDAVAEFFTRNMTNTVSRDLYDQFSRQELRVGGDYYIVILGDAREPRGLRPFTYEIAVEVTGEATDTLDWAEVAQVEQAEAAGGADDGGSSQTAAATGLFSWLPTVAQIGGFLGGVAVALVIVVGAWFTRRTLRKKSANTAGVQR